MIYRVHCNQCQTWFESTSKPRVDEWKVQHKATLCRSALYSAIEELTESGDFHISRRNRMRSAIEEVARDSIELELCFSILAELCYEKFQATKEYAPRSSRYWMQMEEELFNLEKKSEKLVDQI